MRWVVSDRFDPVGRVLADRHYPRRKIGAPQFVAPSANVVFRTADGSAVWATIFQRYVKHAFPGAWLNSLFRNERGDRDRSSELIREACAATRAAWGDAPAEGLITFVDGGRVRHKRDPGRCYRRAGFRVVGETSGGLLVLRLEASDFPEPVAALELQTDLFARTGAARGDGSTEVMREEAADGCRDFSPATSPGGV